MGPRRFCFDRTRCRHVRHGSMCIGRLHPALLSPPKIAQSIIERLCRGIVRRRAPGGHHLAEARSGERRWPGVVFNWGLCTRIRPVDRLAAGAGSAYRARRCCAGRLDWRRSDLIGSLRRMSLAWTTIWKEPWVFLPAEHWGRRRGGHMGKSRSAWVVNGATRR
jgi:hypothetical protein